MYRPKIFKFVNYQHDSDKNEAVFYYQTLFANSKPVNYAEKIVFPGINLKKIDNRLLDSVLASLHLMLGISYYKLHLAPEITTYKALSKQQAEFWNKVYSSGLGEFIYRNRLSFTELADFPFTNSAVDLNHSCTTQEKMLVGIGGGKDSVVLLNWLQSRKEKYNGFIVETENPNRVSRRLAEKSKTKALIIKRFLDSKLLPGSDNGYTGHVPISAIYAFLGILPALSGGFRYIVVGNEYSSNFGSLRYQHHNINHQWSKSAEFETIFNEYLHRHLTPNLTYFSLLRPFYEIRIAKQFSHLPDYFKLFSSCNQLVKITNPLQNKLWCGTCPKCAFTFLLFAPFISKSELVAIFGKNLLEDENLLSLYADLLGFGQAKPFDCVGTFEESRACLLLSQKEYADSPVIKQFLPQINFRKLSIPGLFSTQAAANLPDKYKFIGIKNALLLGYGQEGKATHNYLKVKHPDLKIGVADQKDDSDYLSQQKNYDLIIKTPGIRKSEVAGYYTTASNIFFSSLNNLTIGITGSKGKSTTASLVHAILTSAGIKSKLVGNIGRPMLEVLLRPVNRQEVFVIELSSYQLDDLHYSPNIAVVTALFPEHMNYHTSSELYYQAKKNIINFQNRNDFFIYNPKSEILNNWSHQSLAAAMPFIKDLPFKKKDVRLQGEHNWDNIRAAVTAVKLLQVSDAQIRKAVHEFKPLPHRLEFIGRYAGIDFYDDAISTAPESTICALNSLNQVKTIFLGGEDRGYDFTNLLQLIRDSRIENLVLFPESGNKFISLKKQKRVLSTSSMQEAVRFAFRYTPRGSICLLSTASPSYSLWKDFKQKGDSFKKAVKAYAAKLKTQ